MKLFATGCTAFACAMPHVSAGRTGAIGAAAEPAPPPYQVETVVMLLRHGVRAGFHHKDYVDYGGKAWPDFDAPSGQLTDHGREALVLWGAYHRTLLGRAGVFAVHQSLGAEDVVVETSPVQRTRETAECFMRGLSPGFRVPPSSPEATHWFLPLENGVKLRNYPRARAVALETLGMSLSDAQAHYRPVMQDVERALCIPEGRFSNMPWRMDVRCSVHLTPLDVLDDMLETVRMQYASGMPIEKVAFGHAPDAQAVASLMQLHSLYWRTVNGPRDIALYAFAPLFAALSSALLDDVTQSTGDKDADDKASTTASTGNVGAAAPPRLSKSRPKLAVYVGHDTNITPIRAILGFDWALPGDVQNDQQPGGIIMFERVREVKTGERFVRVSYHAQTLDQIRHLTPLAEPTIPAPQTPLADHSPEFANRPFRADFAPPPSWGAREGHLIPIARYREIVRAVAQEGHP